MKFSIARYLCITLCLFFSTLVSSQQLDSLYSQLSKANSDSEKVATIYLIVQRISSKDSINHYINEAIRLGRKTKKDESIAESIITKGYVYHKQLKEQDSGQYFIRKGIALTPNSPIVGAKGNYAMGNLFTDLRKIDSAVFYYQKALTYDLSNHVGFKNKILLGLGRIYSYSHKLDKAEKCLQEALDHYVSGDEHDLTISTYQEMSILKRRQGKYASAIENLDKALDLSKKVNNEKSVKSILLELSLVLRRNKEYDKSLKYAYEVLDMAKKDNDLETIIIVYTRLSSLYGSMKKYNLALQTALDGLKFTKNSVNKDYWNAILYQNLAAQYGNLQKYDSTIYYTNKTIELLKNKPGEEKTLVNSLLNLSLVHIRRSQFKKAEKRILEVVDIAQKNNLTDTKTRMYEFLSYNYELQGDFRKALVYYQRHKAINDSIFSVQKNKAINELQVKYETEKKEKEILDLSKTTEVQSLKLKNSRYLIFGLILFLGLLILVFFLVVKNYRRRIKQRKTELQLYLLQRQMSPHFISNALSSIQHSILKDDRKVAYGFHSKFSSLIRNILTSSVQDEITLQDEIDMLKNYIEIENLRLDNSFSYTINVDPEINTEDTVIPIMLFQPHVENAIFHGLVPSDQEQKELEINIHKENGHLACSIKDNGVGIHKSEKNTSQNSDSHALNIFKERIQLFRNKISYSISDISEQEKNKTGTLVSIQILMN